MVRSADGCCVRDGRTEHLDAIRTGVLPPPPIASHFGFDVVEVGPGEVSFTCRPDESAYNPFADGEGSATQAERWPRPPPEAT